MVGDTRGLFSDFVNVILPRLVRLLQQYPVPRTEFTSPQLDFLCDDFVLETATLFPTYIRIANNTEVVVQREADIEAQGSATTVDGSGKLYLRGIKFAVHDVSFWLRRKVPRWLPFFRTESGLAEVSLLKKGLEADVSYSLNEPVVLGEDLQPLAQEQDSFFTISKVDVRLSSLDLRVRRSQHRIFFFLVRPFVRFSLKLALRWVLSSQLKEGLETLDKLAFATNQRALALQLRGYGPIEAWLSALASPAPQLVQTSFKGAVSGGQSLLEGASLTRRGVVKRDEEADIAIAIGAGAQLLPGEGGPTHYGPHGDHGPGSTGRIAAQVDVEATKAGRAVSKELDVVTEGVSGVVQRANLLQEEASIVQEAAERERRKPHTESREGWRSTLFDF